MLFRSGMTGILFLSFSFILFSCSTYSSININSRFLNDSGTDKKEGDEGLNRIQERYSLQKKENKGYFSGYKKNRIYDTRYLIRSSGISMHAEINNKAVEYINNGMYEKAEFLLAEALIEKKDFIPALNNQGVVYELLRQRENAFKMYSSACLKNPENELIKWNFYFFCNNKPDSHYDNTPEGIFFLRQ
ncbi:MAG: hypothetical protein JW864_15530 [Spirochaetes bacterium]|nr:hypothetical protein [Spirochaetota bacterium]